MMHASRTEERSNWGSYKAVGHEAGEDEVEHFLLEGEGKDFDDDFGVALEDAERRYREKLLVRKLDRRIMPCLFAMIVLKYVYPPAFLAPEHLFQETARFAISPSDQYIAILIAMHWPTLESRGSRSLLDSRARTSAPQSVSSSLVTLDCRYQVI
jgi:hypothetical protein